MISTMCLWRRMYAYTHTNTQAHAHTLVRAHCRRHAQCLAPEIMCVNSSPEEKWVVYSLSVSKRLRKTKNYTNLPIRRSQRSERFIGLANASLPQWYLHAFGRLHGKQKAKLSLAKTECEKTQVVLILNSLLHTLTQNLICTVSVAFKCA